MTLRTLVLALSFCGVAAAHDNVPSPAQSQPVVITGATVHTVSGAALPNAAVRFENGKLVAVGGNVSTDGAQVVDAGSAKLFPPR